jgi:oligopeptide transport system ATP-binding protein
MSANDEVLSVRDLRISFFGDEGEVPAVDGVSFGLRRGRVLALVGESGSGKSVTSLGILRLTQPPGRLLGGQILFRPAQGPEVDLAALPAEGPQLRKIRGARIGMIFQEPMTALSPVHTIGDQVGEVLRIHKGWSRAACDEACVAMLARVGIADPTSRLRQYPFEMSGGMRQRIVIAMAMICNPDVVIADEPTTALDVTIQAQILKLMRDLQQEQGTSILLVTHDLGIVAQLADDIAVMYCGRIVETGACREVLLHPRHPYTRGLIASLPSLAEAGRPIHSIRGTVPSAAHLPPGCPFHPRCEFFRPGLCDSGERPSLVSCGEKRSSACLRVADLPDASLIAKSR